MSAAYAQFEYPAQTVTIALCKEHCAQYEVKMVRPAQYGPPAQPSHG